MVTRSGSADRVYDTLRQGILDGTYAQGARLGEADLADALGVSRTPVREALRRLGSEGLLATLPNKGARVRTWTAGELGDIFDLRALLEGHAAARAATRVTDADISAMNDLVTRMEAATGARMTKRSHDHRCHRTADHPLVTRHGVHHPELRADPIVRPGHAHVA